MAIIEKFKGGPVGITTIATAVGEEPGTLEEVYEPFLIQEGFLHRTPRGREATEKAFKHLVRNLKGKVAKSSSSHNKHQRQSLVYAQKKVNYWGPILILIYLK